MEHCVVIANKKDMVKSPATLLEREKKLRQVCDYFDIPKLIICSIKKDSHQKTLDTFNEICKELWEKKLKDPRYAQEFKVGFGALLILFLCVFYMTFDLLS